VSPFSQAAAYLMRSGLTTGPAILGSLAASAPSPTPTINVIISPDQTVSSTGMTQESGTGPGALDRARQISGIDGGIFDPRPGEPLSLRDLRMIHPGFG
jgi:hypothetical protein